MTADMILPALAQLQQDFTSSPEVVTVVCGLFGLVIGSFLNAAIHRLPRPGLTISKPRRSACPACGRSLSWRENVPLISWLVQLGRCRGCGWRIPLRYPLVEALTAGLFVFSSLSTQHGDFSLLAVRLLAVAGLLVATFVDLEFFEIPDQVSLGGMALGPIVCLAVPALHADSWIAIKYCDKTIRRSSSLARESVHADKSMAPPWTRILGRSSGITLEASAGTSALGPGSPDPCADPSCSD